MLQWSERRKALWEAVTKVASLELSRRAEKAAAFTAEWTTQRPRPLRGGHCLLNFMSHEKRGPPLFHRECQKTPLPHLYLTHPVGLHSGRATYLDFVFESDLTKILKTISLWKFVSSLSRSVKNWNNYPQWKKFVKSTIWQFLYLKTLISRNFCPKRVKVHKFL